ncbi:MAG TPA: bile acid:sodium symporter [Candidatus Angelobacter sp.]
MEQGQERNTMRVDAIINLLATIALFFMMVGVGLGLNIRDLLKVARDWKLALRAGIANYLLVPAAAVGLLFLFQPKPMVAAGFLIAVVCPGAPFAPVLTTIAKGSTATAVGVMAILAGSSAIIAPLLLRFLLPWVAGNGDLNIRPIKIISTLIMSQFLPLGLGLALHHAKPRLAERLQAPLNRFSTLLNLGLITLILVAQFKLLQQVHLSGYLGMSMMVGATLFAGWLLGGPDRNQRKTMAITTSARNVGVALVIVASSFPGTEVVTAATAFALFQIIAVVLVAVAWGRRSSETRPMSKAAD